GAVTDTVQGTSPFAKPPEARSQTGRPDQRRERLAELRVDGVEQLGGQVLAIDPLLLRQLASQLFTNRLGQTRHLGGLTRHQRVRLDVEDEVLWCSLDP